VSEVLGTLERSPAVCDIVHLPGAALRPRGDVVMCDIPREAASIVIGDLRGLGLEERGSISLERPEAVLSAAAERAEQTAPGDPTNAVVWEEVEALTNESTELTATFVAFIVLSTLIAAVGIFLNSPILIVGGMVLGPEFGPLASFSVALVQGRMRHARRSLLALLGGFPIAIAAALIASLVFKWTGVAPDTFSEEDHAFAEIISHPDAFSFVVAACAGIAGILSLTTAKSGALTGVLISVTTIPAAANVAVTAAYEDWSAAAGSLLQLGINLSVLCVAGIGTLLVQRAIFHRRRAGRPLLG
jgi:uncharacterized hydrophobic protein (TIGR00271 family)